MAEQALKRRRDELLAAAGSGAPPAGGGLIVEMRATSTTSVIVPEPDKPTLEVLYLGLRNRGPEQVGDESTLEVVVLNIITTGKSLTGPTLICVDKDKDGKAVRTPAWKRCGENNEDLLIYTDLKRVEVLKKWTDTHRYFAEPWLMTTNQRLGVGVKAKFLGNNLPRPGNVVMLHNVHAALYDPTQSKKYKAKKEAEAAAALGAAVAPAAPGSAPVENKGVAAAVAEAVGPVVEKIASPGIYWKAGGFTRVRKYDDIPLEHLIPMVMPYEHNLLPWSLAPMSSEYAKPFTALPNMLAMGMVVPKPSFRLSVNRWLRGDALGEDEDGKTRWVQASPGEEEAAEGPVTDIGRIAYVLPDEMISARSPIRGCRTALSKNNDKLDHYDTALGKSLGLSTSLFASVQQFRDFTTLAKVDIAIQDEKLAAGHFITLGYTCWPLAERVLFPGSGLPPMPYFTFLEPAMEASRNLPSNNKGEGSGADFAICGSYNRGPVIPRFAETAHRYWMPVTAGLIRTRYMEIAEQGPFEELYAAHWRASLKWVTPETLASHVYMANAGSEIKNRGFIPLDSHDKAVPTTPPVCFDAFASQHDFFALPVMDLPAVDLSYPLVEDGPFMKCEIVDPAEGTKFVIDSMKRATRSDPRLKKMTDQQALVSPDFWLMAYVENRGRLRLPRWTFVALPKGYVPMEPSEYVQPSTLGGLEAEPAKKKHKIDLPTIPTAAAQAEEKEDKMELDGPGADEDEDDGGQ